MLKKIAFLVKRADLTDGQFREHWRHTHGDVVSRSPGYAAYRSSYTQNHVLASIGLGRPFAWSGMAEFELPSESANEDDFATTEIYRDRIAVDERRFIDMDATVSFTASETSVAAGRTRTKIVLVAARRPGSDLAAAGEAELALADPELRRSVVGWAANEVLPASFRLPGARTTGQLRIDAVHELWLAGPEEVARAAARVATVLADAVDFDRSWSFLAQQFVFFESGRPVTPEDVSSDES